jgi:hypothetical protein
VSIGTWTQELRGAGRVDESLSGDLESQGPKSLL